MYTPPKPKRTSLSAKSLKKEEILKGLEESIKQMKLHLEGKIQLKSIEQLLNEL